MFSKKIFNWFYNNCNQHLKRLGLYSVSNNLVFHVTELFIIKAELFPSFPKEGDVSFNTSLNGKSFFDYFKVNKKYVDEVELGMNFNVSLMSPELKEIKSFRFNESLFKQEKEKYIKNEKKFKNLDSIIYELDDEEKEYIKNEDIFVLTLNEENEVDISPSYEKDRSIQIKLNKKFLINFKEDNTMNVQINIDNENYITYFTFISSNKHIKTYQTFRSINC